MPTFDGGHYFLTVLIPIRTDVMNDGHTVTSPVHALRKRLDMIPTAAETPLRGGGQSPFARNRRNHFVRFVIIDDVAYNGRLGQNVALGTIANVNLTVAQPQDHLKSPFLVVVADFDAKSGSDKERDSYLVELWNTAGQDMREIFRFCQGFDTRVRDAASFAAYMADCQLETTMSFNDYYADPPVLPAWPADMYKWPVIVSGGALLLGLAATLLLLVAALFGRSWLLWLPYSFGLALIGAVALALIVLSAYLTIMAAGGKPFPTASDSDLPTVLKSLYLRSAFTRFVIASQMQAAGTDAASAQKLYDDFKSFVAHHKPHDLDDKELTQAPGVIGI
jgi:hypothetical protein